MRYDQPSAVSDFLWIPEYKWCLTLESVSLHPQASSQLPQMAATWWPLCSQRREARGSRRSCRCPVAASWSWTPRASLRGRRDRGHLMDVTAAARPHWVWCCLWRGETKRDSRWRLENSPSLPPRRSCHHSAPCFFTLAHQNGSPAFLKTRKSLLTFLCTSVKKKSNTCNYLYHEY